MKRAPTVRTWLAAAAALVATALKLPASVPRTVEFGAPAHGGTVTAPTDITGSLTGGDVAAYTLQARACADDPADPASWRTLADGAAPLGAPGAPAVLGTLDPTLLRNGAYELRVIAADLFGGVTTFSGHTVIIEGAMKVGHFQLAFEDLNIPLSGIPVQLIRSYDSRGTSASDFGPDWELGFRSVQVQGHRGHVSTIDIQSGLSPESSSSTRRQSSRNARSFSIDRPNLLSAMLTAE